MNLREFVLYVYFIAFIISLIAVASIPIPSQVWKLVPDWEKTLLVATLAFSILVGFCGVLLAYFVKKDEELIEWLREDVSRLKTEIDRLVREKVKQSKIS